MAISWAGEKPTIRADDTMPEHPDSRHVTPSTAKNTIADTVLR